MISIGDYPSLILWAPLLIVVAWRFWSSRPYQTTSSHSGPPARHKEEKVDPDMSSWLSFLYGSASRVTRLWYASEPAYIDVVVGEGKEGKTRERMSVRAFVESKVASLKKGYWPTWWLWNGHLQTVFCVIGDFSKQHTVTYTRTLLALPDGGTLSLDFAGPTHLPPETAIIVVCHGLAGGSHEIYVRNIVDPVTQLKEEGGLGYRAVVVNSRGCAGTAVTSPQMYSAGNTNDLRTALLYLSTRYPDAPLIGIAFSLGACIMTRYLGEEGESSRMKAGIVLGCPWNLVKNSDRLENTWWIRQTYSKAMGANLVKLMKVHLPSILSSPVGSEMSADVKTLLAIRAPTLKTVDQYMTRHIGGPRPPFPFQSATAYHTWASCHNSILTVRVPLLCMNASDDPIITDASLPFEQIRQSPWVVLGVTNGGGHLGWFEGGGSPPNRWIQTPILEYLRAAIEDYIPSSNRPLPGWKKQGDFIVQEDRPDIGYRELEGKEEIDGAEGDEGSGLVGGL